MLARSWRVGTAVIAGLIYGEVGRVWSREWQRGLAHRLSVGVFTLALTFGFVLAAEAGPPEGPPPGLDVAERWRRYWEGRDSFISTVPSVDKLVCWGDGIRRGLQNAAKSLEVEECIREGGEAHVSHWLTQASVLVAPDGQEAVKRAREIYEKLLQVLREDIPGVERAATAAMAADLARALERIRRQLAGVPLDNAPPAWFWPVFALIVILGAFVGVWLAERLRARGGRRISRVSQEKPPMARARTRGHADMAQKPAEERSSEAGHEEPGPAGPKAEKRRGAGPETANPNTTPARSEMGQGRVAEGRPVVEWPGRGEEGLRSIVEKIEERLDERLRDLERRIDHGAGIVRIVETRWFELRKETATRKELEALRREFAEFAEWIKDNVWRPLREVRSRLEAIEVGGTSRDSGQGASADSGQREEERRIGEVERGLPDNGAKGADEAGRIGELVLRALPEAGLAASGGAQTTGKAVRQLGTLVSTCLSWEAAISRKRTEVQEIWGEVMEVNVIEAGLLEAWSWLFAAWGGIAVKCGCILMEEEVASLDAEVPDPAAVNKACQVLAGHAHVLAEMFREEMLVWLRRTIEKVRHLESLVSGPVKVSGSILDWLLCSLDGLKPIRPMTNEKFDEEAHELDKGWVPPEKGPWIVERCVRTGYRWGSEVVCKAVVVVRGSRPGGPVGEAGRGPTGVAETGAAGAQSGTAEVVREETPVADSAVFDPSLWEVPDLVDEAQESEEESSET